MSWCANGVFLLRDERIAPLAVSALPAWLWNIDASRILWANPTGAAIFGAATSSAIRARKFDAGQPASAQIADLADKLPKDGSPLTVQLRGFGAGVGRALACRCSRITLADGSLAILVAAHERAGPDLPIDQRVSRLLAGCDQPVAAFSVDGRLIHATLGRGAFSRQPEFARCARHRCDGGGGAADRPCGGTCRAFVGSPRSPRQRTERPF